MDFYEKAAIRQQDLNYQHRVCDMHPELAHLRPEKRSSLPPLPPPPKPKPKPSSEVFREGSLKCLKDAARECAKKYDISVQELIGASRQKHIIPARIDFVRTCRVDLKVSLDRVAYFMNGRDHSTIHHYWRLGQKRLQVSL